MAHNGTSAAVQQLLLMPGNHNPRTVVSTPQNQGAQAVTPVVTPAMTQVPSFGQRIPPWQNNHPFTLHPLSNRIKKCAGCDFAFRDPLGPLYVGVVLQHKERDVY